MTKDEFWALCEPGEERTVYVLNHGYAVNGRLEGVIKDAGEYGNQEFLIDISSRNSAYYVFYSTTTAVV